MYPNNSNNNQRGLPSQQQGWYPQQGFANQQGGQQASGMGYSQFQQPHQQQQQQHQSHGVNQAANSAYGTGSMNNLSGTMGMGGITGMGGAQQPFFGSMPNLSLTSTQTGMMSSLGASQPTAYSPVSMAQSGYGQQQQGYSFNQQYSSAGAANNSTGMDPRGGGFAPGDVRFAAAAGAANNMMMTPQQQMMQMNNNSSNSNMMHASHQSMLPLGTNTNSATTASGVSHHQHLLQQQQQQQHQFASTASTSANSAAAAATAAAAALAAAHRMTTQQQAQQQQLQQQVQMNMVSTMQGQVGISNAQMLQNTAATNGTNSSSASNMALGQHNAHHSFASTPSLTPSGQTHGASFASTNSMHTAPVKNTGSTGHHAGHNATIPLTPQPVFVTSMGHASRWSSTLAHPLSSSTAISTYNAGALGGVSLSALRRENDHSHYSDHSKTLGKRRSRSRSPSGSASRSRTERDTSMSAPRHLPRPRLGDSAATGYNDTGKGNRSTASIAMPLTYAQQLKSLMYSDSGPMLVQRMRKLNLSMLQPRCDVWSPQMLIAMFGYCEKKKKSSLKSASDPMMRNTSSKYGDSRNPALDDSGEFDQGIYLPADLVEVRLLWNTNSGNSSTMIAGPRDGTSQVSRGVYYRAGISQCVEQSFDLMSCHRSVRRLVLCEKSPPASRISSETAAQSTGSTSAVSPADGSAKVTDAPIRAHSQAPASTNPPSNGVQCKVSVRCLVSVGYTDAQTERWDHLLARKMRVLHAISTSTNNSAANDGQTCLVGGVCVPHLDCVSAGLCSSVSTDDSSYTQTPSMHDLFHQGALRDDVLPHTVRRLLLHTTLADVCAPSVAKKNQDGASNDAGDEPVLLLYESSIIPVADILYHRPPESGFSAQQEIVRIYNIVIRVPEVDLVRQSLGNMGSNQPEYGRRGRYNSRHSESGIMAVTGRQKQRLRDALQQMEEQRLRFKKSHQAVDGTGSFENCDAQVEEMVHDAVDKPGEHTSVYSDNLSLAAVYQCRAGTGASSVTESDLEPSLQESIATYASRLANRGISANTDNDATTSTAAPQVALYLAPPRSTLQAKTTTSLRVTNLQALCTSSSHPMMQTERGFEVALAAEIYRSLLSLAQSTLLVDVLLIDRMLRKMWTPFSMTNTIHHRTHTVLKHWRKTGGKPSTPAVYGNNRRGGTKNVSKEDDVASVVEQQKQRARDRLRALEAANKTAEDEGGLTEASTTDDKTTNIEGDTATMGENGPPAEGERVGEGEESKPEEEETAGQSDEMLVVREDSFDETHDNNKDKDNEVEDIEDDDSRDPAEDGRNDHDDNDDEGDENDEVNDEDRDNDAAEDDPDRRIDVTTEVADGAVSNGDEWTIDRNAHDQTVSAESTNHLEESAEAKPIAALEQTPGDTENATSAAAITACASHPRSASLEIDEEEVTDWEARDLRKRFFAACRFFDVEEERCLRKEMLWQLFTASPRQLRRADISTVIDGLCDRNGKFFFDKFI